MAFKTLIIAAAASLTLATGAFANGLSISDRDFSGSTIELGQVTTNGEGTIAVYDYHRGEQGRLLGSEEINSGANYDVRVSLRTRPIHDVLAVLTVNGQVVDQVEFENNQ